MPLECYRTAHTPALNKVSARLVEAREFIFNFAAGLDVAGNIPLAQRGRWYGNASAAVCSELTKYFNARFNRFPGHLPLLRRFLSGSDQASFPILNHFHMVLSDPYYRWAASEYCAARYEAGQLPVSRTAFEADARRVMPERIGAKAVNRYCRNILTALRDNGYLSGQKNKEIASPALPVKALAFIMYSLSDFGSGFNEFDGSPVFKALLKPRDLLAPLFRDGERLGFWEFTGDRARITGHLRLKGLTAFLEEIGL